MKSSLLILPLLMLIIPVSSTAAASHHHPHQHTKCTQLWVYTFPVQKDGCIVFKHPSRHELEKANRANIEFNKGVEAGHLRTHVQFYQSTQQPNGLYQARLA